MPNNVNINVTVASQKPVNVSLGLPKINVTFKTIAVGTIAVGTTKVYPTITAQVWNEQPTGLKNGTNTSFTTSAFLNTSTTRLFKNGLRLKIGLDYTEGINKDRVIFTTAPISSDVIIIDYEIGGLSIIVGG